METPQAESFLHASFNPMIASGLKGGEAARNTCLGIGGTQVDRRLALSGHSSPAIILVGSFPGAPHLDWTGPYTYMHSWRKQRPGQKENEKEGGGCLQSFRWQTTPSSY